MRVIKNGKEKVFYAQCNNCASEIEYTFEDVQFTKTDIICEIVVKKIICPICGEEIYVSMRTKEEWDKFNLVPYTHYGCGSV